MNTSETQLNSVLNLIQDELAVVNPQPRTYADTAPFLMMTRMPRRLMPCGPAIEQTYSHMRSPAPGAVAPRWPLGLFVLVGVSLLILAANYMGSSDLIAYLGRSPVV